MGTETFILRHPYLQEHPGSQQVLEAHVHLSHPEGKYIVSHNEGLPHRDHAMSSASSHLPLVGNVPTKQTQFNLEVCFTSYQN